MVNFNVFLILISFFSSIFWANNVSANWTYGYGHTHVYPPVFVPQIPIPHSPYTCAPNTSSVCTTNSGRQCNVFANYYQPNWFAACIQIQPFFHACINSPTFSGNVVFQNQCVLRGSSCVCAFSGYGQTYYEAGFVL